MIVIGVLALVTPFWLIWIISCFGGHFKDLKRYEKGEINYKSDFMETFHAAVSYPFVLLCCIIWGLAVWIF